MQSVIRSNYLGKKPLFPILTWRYSQNWGGHYTGDRAGKYGGPEYFSVVEGRTGRELARANHVGVFQKDYDEGLQVYHSLEGGVTEVALHNAKTGKTIWDIVAGSAGDQGRCMVADVAPTSPGCEFWKYGNELFTQDGKPLNNSDGSRKQESSCNAGIWFDGTLNRQLINEHIIQSFTHGRTFTIYRYDIVFNNSSKSNPGWYGDMLGDWREEVIVPSRDRVTDIKFFSTWYPTEHRIPWLMTDHTYYMQAIHENVGYNQPTNVGYYLGSDYESDAEIWAAAAKVENDRMTALAQTTDIKTIETERPRLNDGNAYNLTGQRVGDDYKGIVIINSKKYLRK